jgi:hypothetical protein
MTTIKNTYFGFTDQLSALQKGKVEKSLDQLYRFNGKVVTEKERILLIIKDGFTPAYEENYSYYSRKTDAMTKPKTLYKLSGENSFYEINKTIYNFALHLIESNFTDDTIAAGYIQREAEHKAEAERLESERVAKECQEREEKARIQREKDDAERQEKINNWIEIGNSLMTDEVINIANKIINDNISNYDIKGNTEEIESFKRDVLSMLPQKLGNKSFVIHTLQYHIEEGFKRDYFHVMTIEAEILLNVFNVSHEDTKRTITAKVKAFYDGREYKCGNYAPVEQETFYIYNRMNAKFEERQGEKKTISGLACYINKSENGSYSVTEARTGLSLGTPQTSKKEAIQKARESIEKLGDKLEGVIKQSIDRIGLSPLYQEQTA